MPQLQIFKNVSYKPNFCDSWQNVKPLAVFISPLDAISEMLRVVDSCFESNETVIAPMNEQKSDVARVIKSG